MKKPFITVVEAIAITFYFFWEGTASQEKALIAACSACRMPAGSATAGTCHRLEAVMRKLIDAINNKFGDINPFTALGICMTGAYIIEVLRA